MNLTRKRKEALEKITGKVWDTWHPLAISAFFAFTERGEKVTVPACAFSDFETLMEYHRTHPIVVETWKYDFCSHGAMPPILFPWDFFNQSYPDNYIRHVLEVYQSVKGSIPIDEHSGCKKEAERLGVPLTLN